MRWREASLLRRAPVVRRASCNLQRQASAACHAAQTRRRSLSLGRRRSTRASRACRAALVVVGHAHEKSTAPAIGLSPSARARGATCQLRPPTPRQRRRAGVSLSLGRRHSTRAFCARAPCRAGCGRPVPVRIALRWSDASLLLRAPVVRRASYGLHFAQPAIAWYARPRLGAGCLLEEGAALKLPACAPRRAGLVSSYHIKGRCTG